ncbi:MAG TPA: hypothetical protein VHX49_08785 [Candidatus Acidoferrales bacterium]|jgi:hypothetical protein|nr:hypothetical protein [Candidatus Acidoferrales bacterium]
MKSIRSCANPTIFLRDGREIPSPKLTKFEVANRILDAILGLT